MAADIQMASNSAETQHEIREYKKIIKLRDEIYAGKHPRFKPASQPGSVLRSTAQPANSGSGTSTDKNYTSGVSRSQSQVWPMDSAGQITESQISNILLSKSDVLVNAELKLKRQRIEKELRRQVEEKRQVTMDEEDLNLEEVMEKVGLSATRSACPGNEDIDIQTGEPAPRRAGVLGQEGKPESLIEALRKPPTGPAAMPASREHNKPSRHGDPETKSHKSRDTIPERVYSPPARPHYSATSQLRSPAAPQPVRPANMARVESQEQRMIVEVDAESPYRKVGKAPYRGRVSPAPYIKPEPSSPGYREPATRVQTPDRGRSPSRWGGQYSDTAGRTRYEYPNAPQTSYYPAPPAPLLLPTHRTYDPYSQREIDLYAYPPAPQIDYARRSYTPAYVPPVTSTYPPRPPYDEYDRRYPPPPVPIRQPSRVGRRSASPSGPYRNPRHSSRSVSPAERGRRTSPRPVHAEYRPHSRMPPSPPHIDPYGRAVPQLPSAIQQRGNDIYTAAEYAHTYAPPRERPVYGDERSLYYQPQAPVHYNELPRPESSVMAREAEVRSYRDREYSYSTARQSLPPPPIIGVGYPPPPPEYTRALSRATSRAPGGLPTEILDYPRIIGERGDYNDRSLARPDERERDYGGRASVRPDERVGYVPMRHASVRPEMSRGYGEREYTTIRQQSVRPEGRRDDSREQYIEPLPITGSFVRESGQMQPPPRHPYSGSEYGDSRYGGKY